jgi:hypothetical protein
MTTRVPDYGALIMPITSGLMPCCVDEPNARPWVRLLTRAGLPVQKLPTVGHYAFAFDGRRT